MDNNTSKISTYLLTALAASWVIWVIIQYLGYNPQLLGLLSDHPYQTTIYGLVGSMAVLGILSFWRLRTSGRLVLPTYGLVLVAVGIVMALIAFTAFRMQPELTFTDHFGAARFFFGYTLFYLSMLLVLSMSSIALGRIILRPLKLKANQYLLTLAVGISGWGFVATLLGLMGLLKLFILWPLALLVLFLERKEVLSALKYWSIWRYDWVINHWWELPVAILGMMAIGVYWAGGLKTYPIGFDGALLYANLAHLTASYGNLPGAGQSYAWPVVMALGEVMFQDVKLSILLSHFMFLPALSLAYLISRKLRLTPAYALLVVVSLLTLPFLSFHAMTDEKIDLGLLTMTLAAWFIFLQWQTKYKSTESLNWKNILKQPSWYGLLLLGWLVGFCFSIKYTSLFTLFSFFAVLAYRYGGTRLFWSMSSLTLGIFFASGFHYWGNIPIAPFVARLLGLAATLLGLGLGWYALKQNAQPIRPLLNQVLVFAVGFSVAFSPWAAKHLVENNFQLSVSSFLFGKTDKPELEIPTNLLSLNFNHAPSHHQANVPWVQLTSDQELTAEEKAQRRAKRKGDDYIKTGRREEVLRYLGYEQGISRYLSIPFDLTFNINLPGTRHQHISFLYLALLPLLLLLGHGGSRRRRLLQNGIFIVAAILLLSFSFWSLTEANNAAAMEQGISAHRSEILNGLAATGFTDVWTMFQAPFVELAGMLSGVFSTTGKWPMIINILLLILLMTGIAYAVRPHFKKVKPALRYTALFSWIFSVQWFLLSNSIAWYGFPVFVLLLVIVGYFTIHGEALFGKKGQKPALWILGGAFAVQLGFNLLFLFTSPVPGQPPGMIYNWPMVSQLSQGGLKKKDVERLYNPFQQQITALVNRSPSTKVYRVNTYTQYHIDKNDRRVLQDNQLGTFQKTIDRLQRESDFIQVLKANGFRYIIYDLNTASLDQTPERSLTEKVRRFERLITQDSRVQLLVTDNLVQDASAPLIRLYNGQETNARQGLQGQTVQRGSLALFEIK